MKYDKPRNPEGRPSRYEKPKTRVSLTLTEEGIDGLDEIAVGLGLSRSELVEKIGRRHFLVLADQEKLATGKP